MIKRSLALGVVFLSSLSVPVFAQPDVAAQPAPPLVSQFTITFDSAKQAGPYTGRVYLVLSKSDRTEPRLQMDDWFGGTQVIAMDVDGLIAGGSVIAGPSSPCLGYPKEFKDVAAGTYTVQAVARRNIDSCHVGRDAGDLYSKPVKVAYVPHPEAGDIEKKIELKLTEEAVERPFRESDRVKLVEIVSPSLSAFAGREIKVRAGVYLPEGWKEEDDKKYPTVYFITGFGGDHRQTGMARNMVPKEGAASQCIFVVPDPTCYLGHSVFADSANNGPRGKALIEELIPAIERKYHGAGSGEHRYVTGISSGGWSCLWLQITYPESFRSCWSHCPDPVDFRDFQQINIYAPHINMYKDEKGERRPLARQGDQVMLRYDDFVRQETVMGPGGQIHSFEAVFSPRGTNGKPRALFDRETGEIDLVAAKEWEKYDIRFILERNWSTLAPKLKGKLHIYAGGMDTFYLDGAVKLLDESIKKLDTAGDFGAEVKIVPGMPHMIHSPGMKAMFDAIAADAADPTPKRPPVAAVPPLIAPIAPPIDGLVLFDGTSLDQWTTTDGKPAPWKIDGGQDGAMTIVPGSGSIISKMTFRDARIHVEFMEPKTEGQGQDRGNSGVYLQSRYEVQILDSYQSDTYPLGQCGAIYGQHVPLVNVCRAPELWQTYDIEFHAARFDPDGKKIAPARATVHQNGVLIHNDVAITGPTGAAPRPEGAAPGPLYLQDHGHAVKFRNIWMQLLDGK